MAGFARRIVIGIGNPDRGDDAAGRMAIACLRDLAPPSVDIIDQNGEAADLLEQLEGADVAYLIDASAPDRLPGTVRRFDVSAAPLPRSGFAASTHGFGLPEAVELARSLGQLPARCIVYAIEGSCFEVGAPVTPAVARAAQSVAAHIGDEIAAIA